MQLLETADSAVVPTGDDVGHLERRVPVEEVGRVDEVRLGQHEERLEGGVVGGDEASINHAGSGLRVESRHDGELVGVGDDDALDGVGVVGGAPEHGPALLDPDDPRQGVRSTARVSDQPDLVPDDDAGTAEVASLHGGDQPLRLGRRRVG